MSSWILYAACGAFATAFQHPFISFVFSFVFFLVHGNIRQADVRYHGNCHRAWDEEEVVVLVGVR